MPLHVAKSSSCSHLGETPAAPRGRCGWGGDGLWQLRLRLGVCVSPAEGAEAPLTDVRAEGTRDGLSCTVWYVPRRETIQMPVPGRTGLGDGCTALEKGAVALTTRMTDRHGVDGRQSGGHLGGGIGVGHKGADSLVLTSVLVRGCVPCERAAGCTLRTCACHHFHTAVRISAEPGRPGRRRRRGTAYRVAGTVVHTSPVHLCPFAPSTETIACRADVHFPDCGLLVHGMTTK